MFGRSGVASDDFADFRRLAHPILLIERIRPRMTLIHSRRRGSCRVEASGTEALSSVGHRLAIEMEAAKPEEIARLGRTLSVRFSSNLAARCRITEPCLDVQAHAPVVGDGRIISGGCTGNIPFIQPDEDDLNLPSSRLLGHRAAVRVFATKTLDLIAAVVGEAALCRVFAPADALSRIPHARGPPWEYEGVSESLDYASA